MLNKSLDKTEVATANNCMDLGNMGSLEEESPVVTVAADPLIRPYKI